MLINNFLMFYVIEYLFTDSYFPTLQQGWFRKPPTGAIYGFGIEGLRDRVQIGQN